MSRPVDHCDDERATRGLEVLEKRIARLEKHLERGFKVDPKIVAEGEYLKQQLAGLPGTEGPGPLFKEDPL